jgi:hypothetical protein
MKHPFLTGFLVTVAVIALAALAVLGYAWATRPLWEYHEPERDDFGRWTGLRTATVHSTKPKDKVTLRVDKHSSVRLILPLGLTIAKSDDDEYPSLVKYRGQVTASFDGGPAENFTVERWFHDNDNTVEFPDNEALRFLQKVQAARTLKLRLQFASRPGVVTIEFDVHGLDL